MRCTMKKYIIVIILLSIIFVIPRTSNAANSSQIWVNGKIITTGISPKIINGHTFVPLRAIAEGLGSKVSWDEKLQKVTVEKYDNLLTFIIGSPKVTINNVISTIEQAPYLSGSSSMLP